MAADYKEFEKMTLNPFRIAKGKFMDEYKIFKQKRFWENPEDGEKESPYNRWTRHEKDMIVRFVVLLIDTESPYYEEKSYDIRVSKCKKALDIVKASVVDKEIDEDGPFMTKVLFEFFKNINNHLYETWFSMKMNLHQMNNYLRRPPAVDKNGSTASDINARRQLSQVITELAYELIEIEFQLFPDSRLQKMINDKATDDGLGGYAEQFAENPTYGH
jgi:hypothetical protein